MGGPVPAEGHGVDLWDAGAVSEYVFACSEGEEVACWERKNVKARKPHVCEECRHPIVPGETYCKDSYIYDGRWCHAVRCLCCEAARCKIAELYSDGFEEMCIIPGELWNCVKDAVADGLITTEELTRPEVTT